MVTLINIGVNVNESVVCASVCVHVYACACSCVRVCASVCSNSCFNMSCCKVRTCKRLRALSPCISEDWGLCIYIYIHI
jgi:hypothetical protein